VYEPPTVAPDNIWRVRTLLVVSSVGAANTAAATYVLVAGDERLTLGLEQQAATINLSVFRRHPPRRAVSGFAR
jgi:hypothetical protein